MPKKYQRRAVIALDVNGQHRQQHMHRQRQQIGRLVHPAAHMVQMQGQGQYKADFGQFRRLESHAAHPVPAVVGSTAGIVPHR